MKTYRLDFKDGNYILVSGEDIIDVVVTVESSQSDEIVKVRLLNDIEVKFYEDLK